MKKLLSCLLVLSMIASMFVAVTAEEASQPGATVESVSYDICTDEKGDPLNPVFINGIEWVEEDGNLKPVAGSAFNFLLFDDTLATKRIEATFIISDNVGAEWNKDHRNGLVFAVTDHDGDLTVENNWDTGISYYWAFIDDWNCLHLWEMSANQQWTDLTTYVDLPARGIDVKQGVTLAAEWDNNGHIKVYADGELVQEVTDSTNPLKGNYYGLLEFHWGNTETPRRFGTSVTSFVTGDAKLTITVAAGEGGKVEGGADNFYRGQSATVTATPDDGYNFVGWFDENDKLVSSDSPYEFQVTGNRDLVAKFTKDAYIITVTPEGNGTVEGAGEYGEGASVTVTAKPDAGYRFIGWYENGASEPVSTGETYTFTANANRTLTAKFEKITSYPIAVDGAGNLLKPVFVNGVVWVEDENGYIMMPVMTHTSYILFNNQLSVNRVEATILVRDNGKGGGGNHRNGIIFALTDESDIGTINSDRSDVSYYWAFINDWGCVEVVKMGNKGDWKWISTSSADLGALGIDVTEGVALAAEWDNEGHIKVFANGILVQDVTDTHGEPLNGTLYGMFVEQWGNMVTPNYYDAPVTSFVAGGALATPDTEVSVTVDPAEGGTVEGARDYILNAMATLTAIANPGYTFVGWYDENDQLVSSDSPYEFKVTGNCDLFAKFTKNTYTITVESGENGTVTGGGSYGEDANVTVTATPENGYRFVGWYENDVLIPDASATYKFEVKANRTLTAKFEKITSYPIAVDGSGNLLDPYFVNGKVWVEENGGIKMPADNLDSFLLFNTPLANNRVEATIKNMTLSGSRDDRNGLIFALTDYQGDATFSMDSADVSYYWAFISGAGAVELLEMGKHENWKFHAYASLSDLGIDVTQGVTLAAEWDASGHVKVFVNGILAIDFVDASPLEGNLYGVLTRRWANRPESANPETYTDTFTSFEAGGALTTPVHSYGTEWGYKGADGHSHICACGAKEEVLAHTPNIAAPTETEDQVCTVCEYVIAEKLGHIHKNHLTEVKAKAADCTTDGNKAYYECECGEYFEDANATTEITDKNSVVIKAGHNYGTLVEEVPAVHTATELKAGMKAHYFCDKCETYFTAEYVATTKDALVIAAPTHAYGTEWGYKGADGHAHVCACGAKEEVLAHTPNIAAPTETEDQVCTACGYVIAAKLNHVHDLTEVKAKAADCTTDGNKAYYTCSCGKWFTDNTATTEITDKNSVVIKAGHNYGTLVEEVPAVHTATELKAGMKAHYFCDKCETYFTAEYVATTKDALVIAAPTHAYGTEWGYKGADGHAHVCACGAKGEVLAHTPNIAAPTETEDQVCTACGYVIAAKLNHVHDLTEVKAKAADCTTDGNKAYYTCSCGKWFEDADATTEITDKNSVIIKAGHNYGTLVEEVPAVHTATELKAGMKAHYFCDKCDTYFTAEKVATTKDALVIAAPTHVDADNDGKCDGCDYNTNPDTPSTPETGDNTLWICLAVVLLSGFAVIGKSLYTQKKRRVED